MRILPLVALINKGETAKSLAIIEGLILVPMIAALMGYLLAQTGLSRELSMSISFLLGFPFLVLYARYASS